MQGLLLSKERKTVDMSEMNEKKEMSFEQALARLEVIVRSLENGSAPLDDSLSLFEEGISLVRLCNEKLENAESKIKILTMNEGKFTETDFTPGKKDE